MHILYLFWSSTWSCPIIHGVIQPGFFFSFVLQRIVSPTRPCIAAIFDSHSDQLLRTLHPNTSVPEIHAHVFQLLQSARESGDAFIRPLILLVVHVRLACDA